MSIHNVLHDGHVGVRSGLFLPQLCLLFVV
jgi:hypothetical protein